ncbi:MAG: restriction endonuclease subunit S [Cephaloticoccus sp.]|nr:restriction endonuclease subunit S [Cephaloticoccus sp.]MCF7759394.1 restriction endonuclease subunit S [Cephaloticoccus sp.]
MKRVLLGDIAKISSGGTPDRANPAYWGGDIPWVKTGEIQFGIIRDAEEKITARALDESPAKMVPPGSLLMAMYGQGKTRGQVALLGIRAAINQACAAISPQDPDDSRYLFQYLAANYENVRRLSNSGSQENLNAELIRGIPIFYPEKTERQKIADILGMWDEALEKLDALIAAKTRRKQALMQQLLTGRRRLQGFGLPWVKSKLGDLFFNRTENNRLDLPLLSITADQGVVSRESLTKRDTSSEDKSKYLRIAPGDIGYNTMRMWQGVSALSTMEGIVSPAYTILTPSARIDGRFTAHLFKLRHTISLFHRHSQGLVDDTLNLKYPHFAKIEVTVPNDVAEQRAIAAVLNTADAELGRLRQQLTALDHQKRGLMQQLLTGKKKVNVQLS